MIRIMRHGLWEVIMETCLLDQYHNSKCIIFGLCEINRQTNTQHLEFSSKLLSHYLSHIILTMRNLSWKWRIFKFRCNIYIYIYIYIYRVKNHYLARPSISHLRKWMRRSHSVYTIFKTFYLPPSKTYDTCCL